MRSINIFKLAGGPGSESPEESKDVVTRCTGGWGRWHQWICLAIFLVKFPVAWHQLAYIFLAPPVSFKCELNGTDACSAECPGYIFDESVFTRTTVTQWELVCDHAWLADLAQTAVMVGILLGNVLFGYLADRWGRREPLIAAVLVQTASGAAAAYVPWYSLHIALRFLCALATGGTMVTSFVLVMELVGPRHRTALGLLYQIPFNLGHLSLAGFAYLLRDWRHLQLAISLPSLLLLSYQFILPESPRWLLATGRNDRAEHVMERIATVNRIPDPQGRVRRELEKYKAERTEKTLAPAANCLDLVRTRTMAFRTISISFNWWACGLCFFGVAQYMGQIPGDVFVNVAVGALVGLPGMMVLLWSLNAVGRRNTLIASNLVTAAACLIIAAAPGSWPPAATAALGCLGLFGMSMAFPTVYMYSGEMYPTCVRNLAVGLSSMVCRVGSMLAPFVTRLGQVQPFLPPLIFGLAPLLSAILCLLLPETKGCHLPDTIEEAERMGRKEPVQNHEMPAPLQNKTA